MKRTSFSPTAQMPYLGRWDLYDPTMLMRKKDGLFLKVAADLKIGSTLFWYGLIMGAVYFLALFTSPGLNRAVFEGGTSEHLRMVFAEYPDFRFLVLGTILFTLLWFTWGFFFRSKRMVAFYPDSGEVIFGKFWHYRKRWTTKRYAFNEIAELELLHYESSYGGGGGGFYQTKKDRYYLSIIPADGGKPRPLVQLSQLYPLAEYAGGIAKYTGLPLIFETFPSEIKISDLPVGPPAGAKTSVPVSRELYFRHKLPVPAPDPQDFIYAAFTRWVMKISTSLWLYLPDDKGWAALAFLLSSPADGGAIGGDPLQFLRDAGWRDEYEIYLFIRHLYEYSALHPLPFLNLKDLEGRIGDYKRLIRQVLKSYAGFSEYYDIRLLEYIRKMAEDSEERIGEFRKNPEIVLNMKPQPDPG